MRQTSMSNDEPFGWWGPTWATPAPRTIVDLIRDRTMAAEVAALLWTLLARRASVVVAAEPSGAGKTTLLSALLDFLPAHTRRLYVRGCYETFGFLDDPASEPERTYLLINEISAHLPIYLWGPGVRRVFGAVRSGFRLAATTHAAEIEGLIQSLAGYPLRVPPADLAAIDLVVILDAWETAGTVRREVAKVAALAATADGRGLRVDLLADRPRRGAATRTDAANAVAAVQRLSRSQSGASDIPHELPDSVQEEFRQRTEFLHALTHSVSKERATGGVAGALAVFDLAWRKSG